jgi:hypothetical protein
MRAKPLRWIFGCNNGLYHSRAPRAWLPRLPFKAHAGLAARRGVVAVTRVNVDAWADG